MANLVPGLLICLMAVQTIQHDGNRTKIIMPPGVMPKTFKGRLHKHNQTNQLYPSTNPWLYVNSEDPVTDYTTGVLSTRVIPSSYILAMLVGIPSNVYILTFLRLKTKSSSTVVLHLNLALSDLLLLLSLALRVHYHLNGNNWIFGEISCRFITALFYGNVYSSAQTIACISLKRYLAVVKPFLYRRLAKTTLTVWTCLVVWFLFSAVIVPELLVRQSYHVTQLGVTTCHDVLPLDEKSHSVLVPYRLMMSQSFKPKCSQQSSLILGRHRLIHLPFCCLDWRQEKTKTRHFPQQVLDLWCDAQFVQGSRVFTGSLWDANWTSRKEEHMNAKPVLHEDILPGVRQPECNQASPDEHRRGHEDGDGLCDPNKRTKNQVPQDCSQLAQSIAESKACSSVGKMTRDRRSQSGVPAVAEYKPLCFLKHQETQPRQCTAETNTHGEDFLRLPTRSHVGVVDLFEDHPGFIMLPHLTGGKAEKREKINSRDQQWSRLLRDSSTSKFEAQKGFAVSVVSSHVPQHVVLHGDAAPKGVAPLSINRRRRGNIHSQLRCSPLFSLDKTSAKKEKTMGTAPPILQEPERIWKMTSTLSDLPKARDETAKEEEAVSLNKR
ncbi:hypothetical protein FQN60_017793 [Etheostoma spectabile]|uniref:G-protein coupled receptors family 1 profile domain-containing protein n=1 Tax=Etheostoma spectabile TaxID=54343 RepID=A0A5J5DG64_9PERO|nr:hypothetical protein FQN60_017793 [Etheostoma spectabile]